MNDHIVNSLPEEQWRAFVDHAPLGNIFHTPEMFQVFARARGCKPQLFASVDGGTVHALMTPVQVSLRGGPLRLLTTRSIAYGGCLYEPGSKGRAAVETLLRATASKGMGTALFTELRNLHDTQEIQDILSDHNYIYEPHLNYLVDLSGSPEQVMQNIGARTRKNIRHALKKGNISVELVSRESQMDEWYALVEKTYQAARVPLTGCSLFKAAFEILVPKGMARFYLARIGSTRIAATAELPYKDVIYGWYSGVDRAYASEYPGELLMWEILRWGAENGYSIYDFGGAGKPDEQSGVRDFKAKFGGRLVCFGRNTLVHSPQLLRLSKWGYEKYRQALKWAAPEQRAAQIQ